MSADLNHITTDNEIIEDLTKDLESQCLENSDIPSDEDNPESPADETPKIPDDHIDEEEIKSRQSELSDEQLEQLKTEASALKNKGNEQFRNADFLGSVETYTEGLKLCPIKYENARAVLYSNRAASKIQLDRKKSAIDDCTKAIELDGKFVRPYLRRAKLYEETEKLDEALADYKVIVEIDPGNHEARAACVRLPPLINERNEQMKTEMLGKLKDLGNMFLKPFGLSTENFQMQQDPNSGSYSVNFQQNSKN